MSLTPKLCCSLTTALMVVDRAFTDKMNTYGDTAPPDEYHKKKGFVSPTLPLIFNLKETEVMQAITSFTHFSWKPNARRTKQAITRPPNQTGPKIFIFSYRLLGSALGLWAWFTLVHYYCSKEWSRHRSSVFTKHRYLAQ